MVRKQLFFIIVLNWSASLWLVWKLEYSCQIFIILFLYPLCVGLLRKWQCSASWLSSQVYVLCLRLWLVWFLNSSFVYLKKEQLTFAGWRSGLPCWLSGEHMPIMIPKPVTLHGSHGVSCFHVWYIVAIPDPGVVYCLRARHKCEREQSQWLFMNSGSQNPLSFNLVKVH